MKTHERTLRIEMPRVEEYWRIPSKLAVGVVCILLGGAMSFNVWAVNSTFERPTKIEVESMIESQSPYIEDRKMILSVLATIKDDIDEIKRMIREK